MAYPATSIGNQFPSAGFINNTDLHARVDVPLDAVAALVNAGPYGSVGHNVLGALVAGITTTPAVLASQAASVVAGRKYKISSYFEGAQVTTTGILLVEMQIASVHAEYLWFDTTAPKTVFGKGNYFYAPGSTASVTFRLMGSTSAGTLSVNAGAFILVEDIGTT